MSRLVLEQRCQILSSRVTIPYSFESSPDSLLSIVSVLYKVLYVYVNHFKLLVQPLQVYFWTITWNTGKTIPVENTKERKVMWPGREAKICHILTVQGWTKFGQGPVSHNILGLQNSTMTPPHVMSYCACIPPPTRWGRLFRPRCHPVVCGWPVSLQTQVHHSEIALLQNRMEGTREGDVICNIRGGTCYVCTYMPHKSFFGERVPQ